MKIEYIVKPWNRKYSWDAVGYSVYKRVNGGNEIPVNVGNYSDEVSSRAINDGKDAAIKCAKCYERKIRKQSVEDEYGYIFFGKENTKKYAYISQLSFKKSMSLSQRLALYKEAKSYMKSHPEIVESITGIMNDKLTFDEHKKSWHVDPDNCRIGRFK